MSNQLINIDNLGMWANAAVECNANPDIFDLCLAIDIHMHIGEKSFDFRGQKVNIVAPNVFVGGRLYDIHSVEQGFDTEGLHKLFADLNKLSLDILFNDVMVQFEEQMTPEAEAYYYKNGNLWFTIKNVFSLRDYQLRIELPHKENNNRRVIKLFDEYSSQLIEFDYPAELARHLVKECGEFFYYGSYWMLTRALHPIANYSLSKRHSGNVQITKEGIVDVGPLRLVLATDGKSLYAGNTIVIINGQTVENGMEAIHDGRSRKAIIDIVKENYSQFLKYAYIKSIVTTLGENVQQIFDLEEAQKKLRSRRSIQAMLTGSIDVDIKNNRASERDLYNSKREAMHMGLCLHRHNKSDEIIKRGKYQLSGDDSNEEFFADDEDGYLYKDIYIENTDSVPVVKPEVITPVPPIKSITNAIQVGF